MKLKQLFHCECHAKQPSAEALPPWSPLPSDRFSSTRIMAPNPLQKKSADMEFDLTVYMRREVENYCELFDLRVDVSIVNNPGAFPKAFNKRFGVAWTPISQPLVLVKKADAILGTGRDVPSDGHGVILLAIAQQLAHAQGMPAKLIRKCIDLSEEAGEVMEGMGDETLAKVFFMYAHALAVRLAQENPQTHWAAFRRSCELYSENLFGAVTHVREEEEHIWRLLCALAIHRRQQKATGDADDFQVMEWLLASLLGFAQVIFEEEHGGGGMKRQVLLERTSLYLTCSNCLNPLKSPVTFGDGSTVCRKCVAIKRRNQTLYSTVIDTKGEFESEHEDTLVPLHQFFGNSFDVILGKLCTREAETREEAVWTKVIKLKEEGNLHYAQARFDLAIMSYSSAMDALSNTVSAHRLPLLAVLFANRSACFRAQKMLAEAQADARLAVAHSKGQWGKAHCRLFESFVLPRSDATEEEIPEAEHVKDLDGRRAKRAFPAAQFDQATREIEPLAALVRALVLGYPVGNTYRRVLSLFFNAEADWLMTDPSRRVAPRRNSSLLIRLVHELVHGTELKRLIADLPANASQTVAAASPAPTTDTSLREALDCILCMNLLCEPVTLPCGHTFCKTCAVRAIDHASTACCPMCRLDLGPMMITLNEQSMQREFMRENPFCSGFDELQPNACLVNFLRTHFAAEYEERLAQTVNEERSIAPSTTTDPDLVEIPIIITEQVCFGRTQMIIAEPADRLLMRRLAHELRAEEDEPEPHSEWTGCFGLCWGMDSGEKLPYGVLVTLEQYETMPAEEDEGYSLSISCLGGKRFTVESRSTRDGYETAKVRLFPAREVTANLPNPDLDAWRLAHRKQDVESELSQAWATNWTNVKEWYLPFEALFQFWKELPNLLPDAEEEMEFNQLPPNGEWLLVGLADALRFPQPIRYYMLFSPELKNDFVEECKFVLRVIAIISSSTSPSRLKQWSNSVTDAVSGGSSPLCDLYPGLPLAFAGML